MSFYSRHVYWNSGPEGHSPSTQLKNIHHWKEFWQVWVEVKTGTSISTITAVKVHVGPATISHIKHSISKAEMPHWNRQQLNPLWLPLYQEYLSDPEQDSLQKEMRMWEPSWRALTGGSVKIFPSHSPFWGKQFLEQGRPSLVQRTLASFQSQLSEQPLIHRSDWASKSLLNRDTKDQNCRV